VKGDKPSASEGGLNGLTLVHEVSQRV
jgi:hypothetical protein